METKENSEISLMENNIKNCFNLFISYIKSNNLKIVDPVDINIMSIHEIKCCSDIIYMKYILSNTFSVPKDSILSASYNHISKLINSYYEYLKINNNKELLDKIKSLESENIKIKSNTEVKKKKGWLY